MEDKELRRAFEKWEVMSGTKEEVAAYRARMKRLFDEESMIGEAEMRGEERGIITEKKSIAQKLLIGNMPLEEVAKITELSIEEVREILRIIQHR